MKLRLTMTMTMVASATFAMVVALLAAMPAQAASANLSVSTRTVAVNSNGLARVWAHCRSTTKTCQGYIYLIPDGQSAPTKAPASLRLVYKVPPRTKKWIFVKVGAGQGSIDPTSGPGVLNEKRAKLVVDEGRPSNVTHGYGVRLQKKVASQVIRGTVGGTGPQPDQVRVSLHKVDGLKTARHATDDGPKYSFRVPLGINNAPSKTYRLSVSAALDGDRHEWFWRTSGAGRYIREGSNVRATSRGPFTANFTYSSIRGRVTGASHPGGIGQARVRVAAPPVSFPRDSKTQRELDVPWCANDYGTARTDSAGNYEIGFLPAGKYFVNVVAPGRSNGRPYTRLWNAESGTCLHLLNYRKSNWLRLPSASPLTHDVQVATSSSSITGALSYSRTGPSYRDRHVTLRTADKARSVVATTVARSIGGGKYRYTFNNLPVGPYKIEYAKMTGCATWYRSVYKNNYAYHQGGDRGNEKWKTVSGKYPEYRKSYAMGYVAKSTTRGYPGSMYRDHCLENVAEKTSRTRGIGTNHQKVVVNTTMHKGATISGYVKRKDGKSNKEMLVTAFRKDNRFVARTDLTDSRGRFKIRGLASGKWSIMVNADSWRGIGRSFSGAHSKSVGSGKSYRVGRLYAKF